MDKASDFLIKICGVTTPEDAEFAAGAGAGAIGINFWPGSKRYVGDRRSARRVVAAIPAGVLKVGVFVNAGAALVEEIVTDLGLDRAQLHGDETLADFEGFSRERLIRAVGILNNDSFAGHAAWKARLYLYDAFTVRFGGEGVAAPWELIAACNEKERPFLLAGGLTPTNVHEAIKITNPDGVDVASGVEFAPGRKNPDLVEKFIEAARFAAKHYRTTVNP